MLGVFLRTSFFIFLYFSDVVVVLAVIALDVRGDNAHAFFWIHFMLSRCLLHHLILHVLYGHTITKTYTLYV